MKIILIPVKNGLNFQIILDKDHYHEIQNLMIIYKMNCNLWADDIILLSESEVGLNILQLKVNTDKTKRIRFK